MVMEIKNSFLKIELLPVAGSCAPHRTAGEGNIYGRETACIGKTGLLTFFLISPV